MKLATDAVVIFHFLSQQKSILVNVSLNYFVVVEGNLKLAPCSIKHDRKDRSWNLMYLITIVNLLIPTLFFLKRIKNESNISIWSFGVFLASLLLSRDLKKYEDLQLPVFQNNELNPIINRCIFPTTQVPTFKVRIFPIMIFINHSS